MRTSVWMICPVLFLACALLVYPLILLSAKSFQTAGGTFSLQHYAEILRNPFYKTALLHSLVLSVSVGLASIALCLGPAWMFVRRDFFGKTWLRALFTIPLSFSGVIVGFFVIILLGRVGFIPQLLERVMGHPFLSGTAYKFGGLLAAYIYFEIPRALLTLESSLRKFDFQLDLAAQSLGAGLWQRLFWVIIPNLWPALASTFSVTFCASLGSFGVALIVSKRFSLFPVEIFQQVTGFMNTPLASAMGLTLVILAFSVNYALRVFSERRAPSRVY